jgi:predicted 3-demethylubiquinone-9 3-methyltransferase (glyoxalase superfamily)
MIIKNNTTSHELKQYFNETFPGLKIEFVKKSHEAQEGSLKKDIITEDFKLSDKSTSFSEMSVDFTKASSANDVEGFFENKLGLHVQVFRQAGQGWIETTTTDDYSLEEQMERAHA